MYEKQTRKANPDGWSCGCDGSDDDCRMWFKR